MLFYPLVLFLLVVNIVCLKFIVKQLKLKNNSYLAALVISVSQFLSYGAIFIILFVLMLIQYGVAGTPGDKGSMDVINKIIYFLIFFSGPFSIFQLLCKTYYDSKFLKNILMYTILFVVIFALYGLAFTIFGNKFFEI